MKIWRNSELSKVVSVHLLLQIYIFMYLFCIFFTYFVDYACPLEQILQNDISPTCLSLYATIDQFFNIQMIFFSSEPAIEHPTPAKVTIYLKITIVSYSYNFKDTAQWFAARLGKLQYLHN